MLIEPIIIVSARHSTEHLVSSFLELSSIEQVTTERNTPSIFKDSTEDEAKKLSACHTNNDGKKKTLSLSDDIAKIVIIACVIRLVIASLWVAYFVLVIWQRSSSKKLSRKRPAG